MLRRFGLLLILVLTGWTPYQSVGAWQAMTRSEYTVTQPAVPQVVASSADELVMADSCHGDMTSPMPDLTQHHKEAPRVHDMQQHGSHCASCLPLCTGIPPAIAPVRELAAQTQLHFPAVDSLYRDFIPGVLSPPPLTLII